MKKKYPIVTLLAACVASLSGAYTTLTENQPSQVYINRPSDGVCQNLNATLQSGCGTAGAYFCKVYFEEEDAMVTAYGTMVDLTTCSNPYRKSF